MTVVAAFAYRLVPLAMLYPNQLVEVPLVKPKVVAVTEAPVTVVKLAFEANRFVLVVFVPLALVQLMVFKLSGLVTVNVPIVALVAAKFVVVALVDVTFVKTPVDGVMLPIAVLLIEPPLIVAFVEEKLGEVKLAKLPFSALTVVPEAVVNPNQVPVAPLNVKLSISPLMISVLVMVALVIVPFTANKFVLVVLVPVAFVQIILVKEEGVEPVMATLVNVALVAVKLVATLFAANMLVVVTEVEVTLVKTPVDGVVFPIGVPLIEPPVITVFEEARLVIVAVVASKLVAVAFVKMAFTPFKSDTFKVAMLPEVTPKVVAVTEPAVTEVAVKLAMIPLPTYRLVADASTTDKLVPVALVKVKATIVPEAERRLVKLPFVPEMSVVFKLATVPEVKANVVPVTDPP